MWLDSSRKGGFKVSLGKGADLLWSSQDQQKNKWALFLIQGNFLLMPTNMKSFKDWFVNRLLCYLEESFIIIMDRVTITLLS